MKMRNTKENEKLCKECHRGILFLVIWCLLQIHASGNVILKMNIRMYYMNVNKRWPACMNDSIECALVFFLTKTILNKSLSALQTWKLPQTRKRRDGFQNSKTVICVEKDPFINEFRCRYRLKLALENNWQWSKTRQRLQNGVRISCDMMSVSTG